MRRDCAQRPGWLGFLLLLSLGASASYSSVVPATLEFIGEARLPAGLELKGRILGGLSGIAYDATAEVYYVVSDEPSQRFPASFFVLEIELDEAGLRDGGVRIRDVVTVQDEPGQAFAANTVDLEGAALTAAGTLLLSSEGQAAAGVPPFVREFGLDGRPLRNLRLPERYLPHPEFRRGVRNNLGFEALTVTPDQRYAIVATENALVQDGPESTLESRSPSRLARFELQSGSLVDEYLYWTEPVASAAAFAGALEVAGLVELVALDDSHLLSLERSFSMGAGNAVRLFLVSLVGATDIADHDSLAEIDLATIRPAAKRLLVDFADLGLSLDNLEGMTFGPQLPDGRRSLIVVGDDNFNYPLQVTQILAFAVGSEPQRISGVQGVGHVSPFEGQWLFRLPGIVIALQGGREAGFWMQDFQGDTDTGASDAIQVLATVADEIEVGDRVEVWGRVVEQDNRYGLTVTTMEASSVEILDRGVELPAATRLGSAGRRPPTSVVDDDGLLWFEPEYDGIDFWESLEGMLVELQSPVVVGPSTRNGELVVLADPTPAEEGRTLAGGVLLRPGDANPERLIVDTRRLAEATRVAVGDRFEGDLVGILDYRFGAPLLVLTLPLPEVTKRAVGVTDAAGEKRKPGLSLATYNVENLDPSDGADRFGRLASDIVDRLGSPDLLALQEVQDNSGPQDDGVVAADATFTALIDAIVELGGPTYRSCQIDPRNGADGGQPGSNIRVGFLYDPERIELRSRASGTGLEPSTAALQGPSGVELWPSPGLIAVEHPAFRGDEHRGFEPARKSLVAEFEYRGKPLYVINNHFKSKFEDDPLFGPRQPPRLATEDQRSQQAAVIGKFVEEIQRLDPGSRVIVLGDFNDHEFRGPLRILESAGLVNLTREVAEAARYSFNYRGDSQLLDHVLVSRNLYLEATPAIEILHFNADAAFDARASDHDPVLVWLHLD